MPAEAVPNAARYAVTPSTASHPGRYPITVLGGAAANYTVTVSPGGCVRIEYVLDIEETVRLNDPPA